MTKSHLSARLSFVVATVLSVAVGSLIVSAMSRSAAAADWTQAHSDVPADPAVLFAALPNGMRYAIMKNNTPKGAVAMWLHIDAGSIQESDAQQGLAHFLEHMAFRGSRHVPEDQVWPGLQRLGMSIGADANATTSWTKTTYQFNLPHNDAASIDTGLLRLRDIASELTLAQRAMDDERGPVLSEERLRDTSDFRAITQFLRQGVPGHIAMSRLPIGQVDVIKNAPLSLIRDFYNAYYRPERATLIVVGDIDPKVIQAKIAGKFADWKTIGPAGSDPRLTSPGARRSEAELFVDPGETASLVLNWVKPTEPHTKARDQADLIEQVGLTILKYRLESLANGPQHPFAQVQLHFEHLYRSANFRFVQLDIRPQDWRLAVNAAMTAVRGMLEYGVTGDEVARATNDFRASRQAAAANATTRPSPEIADALSTSIDNGEVFQSPANLLSLAEELFQHLTAEKVNAVLRSLTRDRGPLLFLTSPTPIEGGEEALTAALSAAEKAPLTAAKAEAAMVWPYTSFGVPGQVVDRKTIADLQTTFVRFANGVRLTVKPTTFATGEILVRVKIGDGRLGLPADRVSPAWAFHQDGFVYGGLKTFSFDEMQRTLAGKVYGISTSLMDDGFLLGGQTRPQDLSTQLQVLAAYVSAPGWRDGAVDRARNKQLSELVNLSGSPVGVLRRDIFGLMHDGDRRWSTPTQTQVEALGPNGLKDVLQWQLASAPLEVSVAGDISVEAAVQAVAGTFGALPRRDEPIAAPSTARNVRFPAGTIKPVELRHKGRADQGIAVVAWPASDAFDLKTEQDFRVLQNVIQWRLTDQLRIHDGATYSPDAVLGASMVAPGFGYLFAFSELPSDKMPLFFKASDAIAADLRDHAISADELERARKPAVETIIAEQQTNKYWVFELLGTQTDPRRLDIIRNTIPALKSVTSADVQRTAQRYLTTAKTWKAEIKPESAGSH